ncbi:MAG TPA: GntR family transcriptional regulator [Papillibacter sp.]|nr:GntR family transcriptional regulator [Papillibacter sp.]
MIRLNYRDSRPIYEQIKDNLRKLIVSGAISAEEKLPSVREMATKLAINPNTIQRAYRELENEGYIYTVPGKGSFAALGSDMSRQRQEELFQKLEEVAVELMYIGVAPGDILAHVEAVVQKEEKKTDD